MKTIAEVERELRHLRQRVRELEGDPETPNAEWVAELTDDSDENSQRQAGQPARAGARR